jgi:ribosomal protein L16 Arg81 hydroxylase
MATDDTTNDDTTTLPDPPAETATGKAGATHDDKATEALRAEAERLRKALAETNRKALADRKFREDVEREKQEKEDQKLGEAERLRKQLQEAEDRTRDAEQRTAKLEADLIERRIDQAIERAAVPLFTRPELASKLVDRARITYDPDADKIGGIKDALESLLKQYPEIGTAHRGGGSPQAMKTRRPEQGGGGGNKEPGLREEFAAMGNYEKM